MRAIIYLLFIVLVFLILRFTLNRVIEIREKQKAQRAASAKQNKPAIKSGKTLDSSVFEGFLLFSTIEN